MHAHRRSATSQTRRPRAPAGALLFSKFESLVHPYPDALPPPPPRTFVAFLWECSRGVRPYLLLMTLFTAGIGAFEALLFSMMAHVVDALASVQPAALWQKHGRTLALLSAVLAGSIVLAGLQALFKYQGVFSNFPMRLRWNFHRLMLEQSMTFYQDEFAGRIATKVMQTALAVRDTWLIFADILVYVVIYFVTMVAVVGGLRRLADGAFPRLAGAVRGDAVVLRAAPGQGGAGAGRRALADDRPRHRRLHQHRHRQAVLAFAPRGALRARRDAGVHGHGLRPDAAGDGLRDRQPDPERAAHRRHRRRQPDAVDPGRGGRRRGGGGHGDGLPAQRHLALGDVGDGLAVRAHRHRAGRHGDAVARPRRGRPAGRQAAGR